MLEIRRDGQGVTFKIKAKPKSKQNKVQGVRGGYLLIAVTAAPEHGKANKAVIEVLAKFLKIAKRQIEIIAGQTSPEKIVRVAGLAERELKAALGMLEII